jgi:rhamnopyranosyl-N-acetylglucosaminyl-diphospho-decaprenol beta-1,3/1,4-galactofuranosyltransferase
MNVIKLTETARVASSKIVCVIVTFKRNELLSRTLNAISSQTLLPTNVFVVDNAKSDQARELIKGFGFKYIEGDASLGGGGGYALGISEAIESGADYVWLADDDGIPDFDCLKLLYQGILNFSYDLVAPLCISETDKSKTANPYPLGRRKVTEVAKLSELEFRENLIQLFNGVLLSRRAILTVGLPNAKLFIRGDELDYYYRIRKQGLSSCLVTTAHYLHPQSDSEYPNSRESLLGVVVPQDKLKLYYQFRNQGYLVRAHNLFGKLCLDWLRYSYYYLVTARFDLKGYSIWRSLWWQGFRNDLSPYSSA